MSEKVLIFIDAGLSDFNETLRNSKVYKIKFSNLISSLRIASMIPGDRKVAGCLFSFSEGGSF